MSGLRTLAVKLAVKKEESPGLVAHTPSERAAEVRRLMGTVVRAPRVKEVPTQAGKTVADVAELLAHTLGDERAAELVDEATAALKLNPDALSQECGLAILEHLAKETGIVGISSRFAMSRIHLNW